MTKQKPPEIDLIPNFDPPSPEDRPPVYLLQQQADLIGSKTGSQVRASVELAPSDAMPIAYDLVLTVPGLGYRHKLLRIEFGHDIWPVTVLAPPAPAVVAPDRQAYIAALTAVFASETFRKVIASMRALYLDDSVVGATGEAILSLFDNVVAKDVGIAAASMEEELARLPRHLREDADAALEGLVRRGFLAHQDIHYSLTEKGTRAVARVR